MGDGLIQKKTKFVEIESNIISDSISDDLLLEILTRIPDSKHVIRCTAVCKRWSALISARQFLPEFVQHRRRGCGRPPPVLLFQRPRELRQDPLESVLKLILVPPDPDCRFFQILCADRDDNHEISAKCWKLGYLSFLPWAADAVIHASCDGWLLLSRSNPSGGKSIHLYICNPDLPLGIRILVYGLVSHHRGGLGQGGWYHHVVLFCYVFGDSQERDLITDFSSSDKEARGRWTPYAEAPRLLRPPSGFHESFLYGNLDARKSITCNGVMFWLLRTCCTGWEGVFTFDPSAGRCSYVPCPPPTDFEDPTPKSMYRGQDHLGTCLGGLRVGHVSYNPVRHLYALTVWELTDHEREDAGSWLLVHSAELKRGEDNRQGFLLAHHPTEGHVVFLLYEGHQVCRYDMSQRTLKKIGTLPVRVDYCSELDVFTI